MPKGTSKSDFAEMIESISKRINWKLTVRDNDVYIYRQHEGKYFEQISKHLCKMELRKILDGESSSLITDVMNSMLEDDRRLFDDALFHESRKKIVGFKNGVFDLETGKLRKYHPSDFVLNPIPYNLPEQVDPDDEKWLLDQVFGQWLGDECASWFADFLGYMLFIAPNTQNLWADFFGVGCNGKSSCLHLIEEILGDDKINGCDLKYIGRFSGDAFKNRWLIIGRDSANVVSEGAASFIKAFTGERKIHIEKKGGAEYDADNMGKLIVSTNYLIQSKDRSYGWYRRIVPIPFVRKFPINPTWEDDLLNKSPMIARILLNRAYLSRKNKALLMQCAPKPVAALRSETRMLNDRIAAFWELYFHKEQEVEFEIEVKGKTKVHKELQRVMNYEKLLELHDKTISEVYAEYVIWHGKEFGETNIEPSLKVFGGPYGAFLQSDAGDYYEYKHTRDGRKICLRDEKKTEVSKLAAQEYQEKVETYLEQEEVF